MNKLFLILLFFISFNLYSQSAEYYLQENGYDWCIKTDKEKLEFIKGASIMLLFIINQAVYTFDIFLPKNIEIKNFLVDIFLNEDLHETVKKIDNYYAKGNKLHVILEVLYHVYNKLEFRDQQL